MLPPLEPLQLASLASNGRLARACALELHRLLSDVALCMNAAPPSARGAVRVDEALSKARTMTRRLLSAAQRPSQTSVFELGNLVEEARPIVGMLAGPETLLVVVHDTSPLRVRANRGDLEQILLNLIEPSPDARRVAITVGVTEWLGAASADDPPLPAGMYAVLAVADEHRSCAGEHVAACQVCGVVPGLGVPLAREIAAANHCGIQVVRDAGITFRVLLPLARG